MISHFFGEKKIKIKTNSSCTKKTNIFAKLFTLFFFFGFLKFYITQIYYGRRSMDSKKKTKLNIYIRR